MTARFRNPVGIEQQYELLDALFKDAPVGLGIWDRELRFVRVNPTLAAINGLGIDEHVGRRVEHVVPDLPEVHVALRKVLETGEAITGIDISGRTPANARSDHTWLTSFYPLRIEGEGVVAVGASVVDVTDRRRAEVALRRSRDELRTIGEQERFLVEAGRILAGSLDLATTLESVAELAVPEIADWCAVDLLQEDGRIRNVALAHADPGRLAVARSLRQFASRDAVSPMPIQRVIETGVYELHAAAGGDLLRDASASEDDAATWRSLDIRSVLILPMVARGRTIGAISFVGAESGREFAEEDVGFAERVAAQCALAVDNARLFGERADIARHLQESLLPPLLPELPGVDLAARYRAAGAGNDVGGDFYDVFPTDPGAWLLAIGDVQGNGPGAAAITGLARYTMRAAATQNPDPAHVLGMLNEALLDGPRFLTVAYMALRIEAGRPPALSIANGGHPTPFLIRADGSVSALGRHGLLVGITSPLELRPITVELAPGDAIVLYTDGVIEAGEEPLGEDGLARLLTGCAGLSADAIADRVAGVVLDAGGTPRDDVAVLVARVNE